MKNLRIVEDKSGKKIAYPADMPEDLISALEKARKDELFVMLTSGDMKTGESWGDLYDSKGVIGLSKGRDYYFPLLISFKRGIYDEDSEETIGEDLSHLSDLSVAGLKTYLDERDLPIRSVLDDGGCLLGSVVAVQTGISRPKVVYKHKNFKGKDFGSKNCKIEKEILTISSKIKSSLGTETVENSTKTRFVLFLDNKVYSRHDTLKDAEEFLKANREINLIN